MLLGLISLLLAQSARWISEICVNSSLFTSQFYICSEKDYSNTNKKVMLESSFSSPNETDIPTGLINLSSHQCGEVNCYARVNSESIYGCIYLVNSNG
jgi:mlo protein